MKHLLKQFNLPTYLKGDSFAKDSKRIQDKYKDTNNKDDKATEMELLDRLRQAQEHVKSLQNTSPDTETSGQSSELAMGGTPGFNQNMLQTPRPSVSAIIPGQTVGVQELATQGAEITTDTSSLEKPNIEANRASAELDMSAAGAAGGAIGGLMTKSAQRDSGRVDVAKNTAGMAVKGMAAGAIAGSVVPGIGNVIGGAVGLVGGAAAGLFGGKSQNRKIDRKEVKSGRKQFRSINNKFALGGNTNDPCGGIGQPPCPELTAKDLVQMNATEGAPLQFVEDESGVAAMNTLFQAAPPPIERATVNYGKYGPVNYFEQDVSDPTGLTLTKGSGQIHNREAIERQFKNIQTSNPGLKLKYNAMGGKINNQYVTEGEPCGGEGQPPCKKEKIEGQKYVDTEFLLKKTKKEKFQDKMRVLLESPLDIEGLKKIGTKKQTKKPTKITSKEKFEDKVISFEEMMSSNKKNETLPFGTLQDTESIEDITAKNRMFGPNKYPRKMASELMNIPETRGLELGENEMEAPLTRYIDPESKDDTSEATKYTSMTANLARLAPTAMNAYQLAKLKKPKAEGYARSNARYKKQLVDEQALQNLVKEATAGTREAIVGSAGGSGSTARANLLASQLQGTKALSDAYLKASGENRAEGAREQQFNLGVDQLNIRQSNIETQAKAQNKGAYDTQKSKLRASLATDIGAMGKEALFKKYPELMGLDFDAKGDFILSDDEKEAIRARRALNKKKK